MKKCGYVEDVDGVGVKCGVSVDPAFGHRVGVHGPFVCGKHHARIEKMDREFFALRGKDSSPRPGRR